MSLGNLQTAMRMIEPVLEVDDNDDGNVEPSERQQVRETMKEALTLAMTRKAENSKAQVQNEQPATSTRKDIIEGWDLDPIAYATDKFKGERT